MIDGTLDFMRLPNKVDLRVKEWGVLIQDVLEFYFPNSVFIRYFVSVVGLTFGPNFVNIFVIVWVEWPFIFFKKIEILR